LGVVAGCGDIVKRAIKGKDLLSLASAFILAYSDAMHGEIVPL
jgi:hypothetical protein